MGIPNSQLNFVSYSGHLKVIRRDRSMLLRYFKRYQFPACGQAAGDPDTAVPTKGANFDCPPSAACGHNELKEATFFGPNGDFRQTTLGDFRSDGLQDLVFGRERFSDLIFKGFVVSRHGRSLRLTNLGVS